MKITVRVFIAVLTITILAASTKRTTNDCQLLHKGTFKYGDSKTEIIVKIKGKKHVEYHNEGKYVIESKLDWVNECEYNMTMTKVTIPNFPYGQGDIMNVKVDKVVGTEIYYTSTVNGQSWNGKFIKID
jgi:hypothetical protein